ncbi:VIT1/CCC1 transporter family protein [Candidatus Woesearchaeota archaeon]|nr:VIT1/CCC1 transporter family protein [Candidatus Woesearchaeota archaeon]
MINNHGRYNLKDIILGGQDGLVNVLGIVLTVASATKSPKMIIISGIAALVAESLSMGAVAYTSSKAAKDYYQSLEEVEKGQFEKAPKKIITHLRKIFSKKGLTGRALEQAVSIIASKKKAWLSTILCEEFETTPREYENPFKSGLIVGLSSVIGSAVPILPFFFLQINSGVIASFFLSLVVLFSLGSVKALATQGVWYKSGLEITSIGLAAAVLGYIVGKLLGVLPL